MKFIQTCLRFCQQLPFSDAGQSCSKLPTMPSSGCLWVTSPSPVFTGFLIPLHLALALFTYLVAILFRWPVRINFPSSLAALPHLGVLVPLSQLWVRTSGSPPGHSRSDKPAQPSRLHLQGGEQRENRWEFFSRNTLPEKVTGSLPISRNTVFSQKIFTATQILELTLNLGIQKRCYPITPE